MLNFSVNHNGSQAALGHVLTADGDGAFEVNVQVASTPEFDQVEQGEVLYYFRGMNGTASVTVDFSIGHSQGIDQNLLSGPSYIRLATVTLNGRETYRCFTNPIPIWIKSSADGAWKLRVNCVGW